jgi:hypothetical protein
MPLSVAVLAVCPRCKGLRSFVNVSQGGVGYLCSGCEWRFTFATQAPTGTSTASVTTASTAITVASGGASFTTGMKLLYDTGVNAEVVTVASTGTATNIPIVNTFAKPHGNVTFGQLLISSTFSGAGQAAVPNPSPYLSGG